jgi:aminopeptidase N
MSFLAMSSIPELHYFHTVWVTFLQYKNWGISADQLSSTHPICCNITSTDQADALFDGISYGKGSAFLKQAFNVLGLDTIKRGLHIYFDKYKWKNTTLPDFVGSLEQAYEESNQKTMGDDFNFSEWCESWLQTSGVNVLEPLVEYNPDSSVKSFAIKQSCDLRGKNQLRMQKLNVAFYDSDMKPHLAKDIIISDKTAVTQVEVPVSFPVKAIIINSGDHAYAKVRYDEVTLANLQRELNNIEDFLERAVIWRMLWFQMTDMKFTSVQYLMFLKDIFPLETTEQVLTSTLMNLKTLISSYLPTDLILPTKTFMFDLLMDMLRKDLPSTVKGPIAEEVFSFVSSPEQMELVIEWNRKGFIFHKDQPETSLLALNKSHRNMVLKQFYKQLHIPLEEKQKLMEEIIGDD